MNHKRKRPKHRRAGCLFCKPWKAGKRAPLSGPEREKPSVRRRLQDDGE